jgi:hypothetical protein
LYFFSEKEIYASSRARLGTRLPHTQHPGRFG